MGGRLSPAAVYPTDIPPRLGYDRRTELKEENIK